MLRPIDAYTLNNALVSWYNDTEGETEKSILRRVMQMVVHAPTLTPLNEPLTLNELREMDGEPVYVVPQNEYSELGKWCVVSIGDSDDYSCALVPGVEYWSWKFDAYGEQWLAYRRPPEGEANA